MSRTRLAAAALAVALPFSAVQIVDAPCAVAATQVRTVTELDREAFDAAVVAWQSERDAVEQQLVAALDEESAAEAAVREREAELSAAEAAESEAREQLASAQSALDEADVDARQRDADAAAETLRAADEAVASLEKRLSEANQRSSEATTARAELDAEVDAAERTRDGLNADIDYADQDISAERAFQAELAVRDRTGADYSVDEWERLTSQAIAEYINEYRVTNGLHPLVTHTVYNDQARAWSEQMVEDIPVLGHPFDGNTPEGEDDAFRHSDRSWGKSGENILIDWISLPPMNPAAAKRDEWKKMPEQLFDDWRNSPGHNKGMLNPAFQGMGVGVQTRENGEIWATTMFFIKGTRFESGGYYPTDAMTRKALASGEDFYVPEGARNAMWVTPIKDPLTDTKGHSPNYQDIVQDGIDLTVGKSTGMDHKVTVVDHTADIAESKEREELRLSDRTILATALAQTDEQLDTLRVQASTAAENERAAQYRVAALESQLRGAKLDQAASRNAKGEADDALAFAMSVDKKPLLEAFADADVALKTASANVEQAASKLASARDEFSAKSKAVQDAQNQVVRLPSRPAEETYMVTTEITETIPDPPGSESSGGEKAGIVIGVLVAILAVVGLGAAALPQLGIQLPF